MQHSSEIYNILFRFNIFKKDTFEELFEKKSVLSENFEGGSCPPTLPLPTQKEYSVVKSEVKKATKIYRKSLNVV